MGEGREDLDCPFEAGDGFVHLALHAMADTYAVEHRVVVRMLSPEVFEVRLSLGNVASFEQGQSFVALIVQIGNDLGDARRCPHLFLALIRFGSLVVAATVTLCSPRGCAARRADKPG